LYLFDGICRHAADIVRKKASGFDYQDAEPPSDSRALPGTKQALVDSASSYLYSASGIVEEIVVTTMQEVREDQKVCIGTQRRIHLNSILIASCLSTLQPKVIKVVDIWIKAGTFDNGLLTDIKKKLTKSTQEDSTASSSNDIPTASNKGQYRLYFYDIASTRTEIVSHCVSLPLNFFCFFLHSLS
jgi:hypothetical protein